MACLCLALGAFVTPHASATCPQVDPEIWIGSGSYVAPIDGADLESCDPPVQQTSLRRDEHTTAARLARLTRLEARKASLKVIDALVEECAERIQARASELHRDGVKGQRGVDIARAEILPEFVARIATANAKVLELECTPEQASLAKRRAWNRCKAAIGRPGLPRPGDAPSAMDADLWMAEFVRDGPPWVEWLLPMFDEDRATTDGVDGGSERPEAWLAVRREFATATVELRELLAQQGLAAVRRGAPTGGEDAWRAALARGDARFLRWRAHNVRYIATLEGFALERGRPRDAALIRCAYLHAENLQVIGAQPTHAMALADAADAAIERDPARAEYLRSTLLEMLQEYARSTDAMVLAVVRAHRAANSRSIYELRTVPPPLDELERAFRLCEARERLMERQLDAAISWGEPDPQSSSALWLRRLRNSLEADSWNGWRLLLDFTEALATRDLAPPASDASEPDGGRGPGDR